MLAFGPNDGYLYISVGDGGGANGPMEYARVTSNPHGKIHRIDVSSLPATAPASNPFVGTAGAVQTIWAYGLRNPWRFSFDRATGDMYIGDVGQDVWEEIDVQPASSSGGEDYGWDEWEANVCFENDTGCPTAGHTFPVYDYSHNDGCSVTGGYVYRGCVMPGYHGTYFFADYCNGWVRSFEWNGAGGVTNEIEWVDLSGGNPSSFGEDANGELLLVRHNSGRVYRIVPQ
jgi:glucose/arabinose dehydrogenase